MKKLLYLFVLLMLTAEVWSQSLSAQDALYVYRKQEIKINRGGSYNHVLRLTPKAVIYLDSAIRYTRRCLTSCSDTGYFACMEFEELGQLFWQRGLGRTPWEDSAVCYYKKSIELDKDSRHTASRCHSRLAQIHCWHKDFVKSAAEINAALLADVNSWSGLNYEMRLLWMADQHGKQDQRLETGYRLVEKFPEDPLPFLAVGAVYKDQKKYDSAKLYLKKGIALSRQNDISAWGQVRLGEIYLNEGEKDNAVSPLKIAVVSHAYGSAEQAQSMLDSMGNRVDEIRR